MAVETAAKVVKTVCGFCLPHCGLNVSVEGGRITGVSPMQEHPNHILCAKSRGLIEWVYSPERLLAPLVRADGGWREVSWDEALGTIAAKLKDLKEKHGAKTLMVYSGNPFIGTHMERVISRFCSLYGTPNGASVASYCFSAKTIGHSLTLSHRPITALPDYRGSRCFILWGTNPTHSNLKESIEVAELKKRGAKLIVIDPRATSLAKGADIHARIRPGTDCALALGMLNVIIGEELYDKDFVSQWTLGFDRLAEHVKGYPPERVAEITWVAAESIREMARVYAISKPAAISQGVSVDHSTNGVQTSRALATLMAITGNYDVRGGNVPHTPSRQTGLRVKGRVAVGEAIGAAFPLFSMINRQTTASPVTQAILSGEPYSLSAMIFHASNPVMTWPNTRKVKEAFARLELLVTIDLFMTETAKLSHVVLPAASFLEQNNLKDYFDESLALLALGNKAIEPLGSSWPDWKVWAELGRRMGWGEEFPWQSDEELFSLLLEPTGITLEGLRRNPGGVFYRPTAQKSYLTEGFHTPSGKVELYSPIMGEHGYRPLPTFEEPLEGTVSRADLAAEYPLILITGTRTSYFTHSQHRNVPSLRRHVPEALLEISQGTAQGLGIGDGDEVMVESPRGRISLRASLSPDIHPQVVSIEHGWVEANANELTDDLARDPVSGFPGLKSVLCRVSKSA